MKVLITGASGFIGSALAKRLEQEGHEVYGLYRYVSGGRHDLYKLDKYILCDIRDRERVDQAIAEVLPEAIYHLAAMTAVSYSFLAPVEVTESIYMGTMHMADACVKYQVPHLIHASTSEWYGKQEKFPITEDAQPRPFSPYAVAKVAAEEYIRFKARTEGLPFTILRPYNTYNRSNVKQKYFVIERAITQALEEGHIHLYTPHPVRDLLDRDSHVDAYIKCLGNKRAIGETINIGTGKGVTIGDAIELVAKLIEEEMGKKVTISWEMAPDRPYDIETLICSNQKAKEILGWQPLYTLEEGLRCAISEWATVLNVPLRGGKER